MTYIAYIFPFLISAVLFLKEYREYTANEYRGWAALKLFGLFYWLLFLLILLSVGDSWFCGRCSGRGTLRLFFWPSIGSAMIMFSPMFAGSVFSSFASKAHEHGIIIIGVLAIFYGHIPLLF